MIDTDELPDVLGEELHQTVVPIYVQLGKLPFGEIEHRFLEVGDTLAPRFLSQGYPLAALETRRLVAHDILSASLRHCTLEQCTEYFNRTVALGSSTCMPRLRW